MRWLVDLLYTLAAVLTMPVWLVRMAATGKIRTDWRGRFGHASPLGLKTCRRVLFHAVSVGEVNAIRLLVEELRQGQQPVEIVVAATTDTGFARAKSLWEGRCKVVRYPFDFSWAVRRFLDAIQPDLAVLVELEVWPNFTAECQRRGIPVVVVNGRLTARSFSRYRWVRPLVRPAFSRIALAAVQNQAYAQRFEALGTPRGAIETTGTMKWDTAVIADDVPGAAELAAAMGIDRTRPLIVAGSTAPEEHRLLLDALPEGAQLLCAPRKPEWFDQAAAELPGCVRRSRGPDETGRSRLFLLDTIGELRQAYALADVVVVGRSFGNLHGSDMMEPVALGKATVVGPAVADFQDTVEALLAEDGIVQTSAERLGQVLRTLLDDPARRMQLGENGRAVIRANQGASRRNAELLFSVLTSQKAPDPAVRRVGGGGEEERQEKLKIPTP